MNARLISNVTMSALAAALRPLEVSVGDYNSLLTELVDPSAPAAGPQTSHLLCVYDSDALLGEAFFAPDVPSLATEFVAALDRFAQRHAEKIIVTHTLCAGSARATTFADAVQSPSVREREATLNAQLVELAQTRPNVVLIDLELIFRRYGEDKLVTPAFWYAGRMRYTAFMNRALATAIQQALSAYGNRARKLLVLDLDNTLWGGILGDAGLGGIELSEEGRGACYRDFQRGLKALERTGVLLAICSKNDLADVDEVFANNPMMILRRDDFAALRVNWKPKPDNLLEIVEELGLGLESCVFIDDSPVERAIVLEALPQVVVPVFPAQLERLPAWLVEDVIRPYFAKYRLTGEDRVKTDRYRANQTRRAFSAQFDLDTFLRELEIVCTFAVDSPATAARASQLSQKTNQFNLTTRRCEVPEVEFYAASPDHALIVMDYADRFGAEGIVAMAMLDVRAGRIANFVMSCRVIGRNVEDRLLAQVLETFRARGVARVLGAFVPTRKNQIVADFYERREFELIAEETDGSKTYERNLA